MKANTFPDKWKQRSNNLYILSIQGSNLSLTIALVKVDELTDKKNFLKNSNEVEFLVNLLGKSISNDVNNNT